MADGVKDVPEKVVGEEIWASYLKTFGMFAASVLFVLVCGVMLWDRWWNGENEKVLPFALTWWGSALAGIGFGIGLLGMIVFPFEFLFPQRLVLGRDVLQVVRSGATVLVQIPYRNIAAVRYERPSPDADYQLNLDLRDVNDPDTYSKNGEIVSKKDGEPTYRLEGGWAKSLKGVAALIEKRCRKRKKSADH